MKPTENQYFGPYKLIKKRGEGSTAEVWECISDSGDQKAIKIFAPSSLLDNYSKELIKEEFEKAKNLSHPHLIVPENYFEEKGVPGLILRLCEKSMWQELMMRSSLNQSRNKAKNAGLFSEKLMVKLINQIALAIHYLHNNSLVHNDIKPANILANYIGFDNEVVFYLTDFGITKEIRDTIIRQTKVNNSLTFAYAAPEKLRGLTGTTHSDIFSLGASVYELLYGTGLEVPLGQILNNNGEIHFDSNAYSEQFLSLVRDMLKIQPSDRIRLDQLIRKTSDYLINGSWERQEHTTIEPKPNPLKANTLDSPRGIPEGRNLEELLGKKVIVQPNYPKTKKNKSGNNIYWITAVSILMVLIGLIAWWIIPSLTFKNMDHSIQLSNGMFLVEKDQQVGILDRRGKTVIDLKYKTGIITDKLVKLYSDNGVEEFELKN